MTYQRWNIVFPMFSYQFTGKSSCAFPATFHHSFWIHQSGNDGIIKASTKGLTNSWRKTTETIQADTREWTKWKNRRTNVFAANKLTTKSEDKGGERLPTSNQASAALWKRSCIMWCITSKFSWIWGLIPSVCFCQAFAAFRCYTPHVGVVSLLHWCWCVEFNALKQDWFCHRNHCMGSGILPEIPVCEHGLLWYPQMQIIALLRKEETIWIGS